MIKFIFIIKEFNNCWKVNNKEWICKETLKWIRLECLLDDGEMMVKIINYLFKPFFAFYSLKIERDAVPDNMLNILK